MVSSSRRTNRKIQLSAPAHLRRKLMSSPLSKELRAEHGVRSIPVVKGDEVQIVRGSKKGAEGRVTQVYRKKWVIHVDRVERQKAKEQTVPIPVAASNVVITKLKLDKSRKAILARKSGKPAAAAADAEGDVEMKA